MLNIRNGRSYRIQKFIGSQMTNKSGIKYYKKLDRGRWAEIKMDDVLSNLPNIRVSDIGSGYGWMGPLIRSRGLIWNPFDQLKKNPATIIWDLNNPVPKNIESAGLVICLEVVEHLSNPGIALKNISSHIAKGGYLILSTPNPFYKKSKFDTLFKNQLYAFQPKHLIEHHVFVPLPHIIEYYLNNEGFLLEEFAIIGKASLPKASFNPRYLRLLIRFVIEKLLGWIGGKQSLGQTQGFVFKKE